MGLQAPSDSYKLSELAADHRDLLDHYNLLYNIAAEMHQPLTNAYQRYRANANRYRTGE